MKWLRLSALILPAAGLTGCASYQASVEPGRDLRAYQRYFVQQNLNDDRGITALIVNALRARGLTADFGPLTMAPDNAEALIMFEDRWAWDFRDNLIALRIGIWDASVGRQVVYADYNGPGSVNTRPADVVERLLAKLLGPPPATANVKRNDA